MSALYGLAGVLLLLFILYDVVKTTLGQGGGPLTSRITSGVWRLATRLRRRRPVHGLLSAAGVGAVVTIVLIWVALLWCGWGLVFSSGPGAVVWRGTGAGVPIGDRFQYAGYALVTLGMGDFEPGARPWRLATALAAATGFSVITLSLAYLTPLVGAATEKRQLALYISTLGESASEILTRAWDGATCRSLEPHLNALTPMLALLAQRHLTYPALHYFHTTDRSSAAAPSLAALDEALTLLEHGCAPHCAPDRAVRAATRRAISALLSTLRAAYLEPAAAAPPAPALAALERAGLPTRPAPAYERALAELDERRRLLRALVEGDGWRRRDVHADGDDGGEAASEVTDEAHPATGGDGD